LRFRQGNFIQLESDYTDEPKYIEQREYYGWWWQYKYFWGILR
jgi:hypothetical protein